ncbi:MAG TPA: restriction endonuclease, partial [Thermoanaerobaculia bacterium]|nr:restriction endonuclease [Thermoanaerobaculia bacterium]
FVIDSRWPRGRTSHWRLTVDDDWLRRPIGRDLPRSLTPTIRGGEFLEYVSRHAMTSKHWHAFISVPVILGEYFLGALSLETRLEPIQHLVATKLSARYDAMAPRLNFGVLHSAAAAAAYMWLRERDKLNPRHAAKLIESFASDSPAPPSPTYRRSPESDWIKRRTVLNPEQLYEAGCHFGIFRKRASRIEIVNITPRLLDLLRESPEHLSQLSPGQFEELVAERLDRMGFDVALTGAASRPDGGIDLVATPKERNVASFLLAAQIKHHSAGRPTTRESIDRLLAWKDSVFRLGLVVTNTRFTEHARWVAMQNLDFLRLRDFDDLRRWLYDDFSSDEDWGELPASVQLAPGIVVEIPRPSLLKMRPSRRS